MIDRCKLHLAGHEPPPPPPPLFCDAQKRKKEAAKRPAKNAVLISLCMCTQKKAYVCFFFCFDQDLQKNTRLTSDILILLAKEISEKSLVKDIGPLFFVSALKMSQSCPNPVQNTRPGASAFWELTLTTTRLRSTTYAGTRMKLTRWDTLFAPRTVRDTAQVEQSYPR